MPRLGTFFEADATYREHDDERMCAVKSVKPADDESASVGVEDQ